MTLLEQWTGDDLEAIVERCRHRREKTSGHFVTGCIGKKVRRNETCPKASRSRRARRGDLFRCRSDGTASRSSSRSSDSEAAARYRVIEDQFHPGDAPAVRLKPPLAPWNAGRRLLRRRKEQIGRHKETGAQTLHHRHAEPLFATHHFTDAAWRAEQREEVSSREAVLIDQVADQIGDASRPWSVSSRRGALHYFRDLSFGGFHPGATAVLVDELDAGGAPSS